jgi:hypothetical protein
MEERKGILTPNQEKGLDELIQLDGIKERLDGPAIRIVDNQIIERAKKKIPAEYLPEVYNIVDELMGAFGVEK